jgi:multicomponent Na+:H+ antiporter subunit B
MDGPFESRILQFMVRLFLVPAMLLFGLYVVVHGETSPGGGFQGGAIMGAAIILARLSLDREQARRLLSPRMVVPLVVLGGLITFGIGVVPVITGGNFLDYGALPLPQQDGHVLPHFTLRSIGILVFELGITITVMAVMVTIFDYLAGHPDDR